MNRKKKKKKEISLLNVIIKINFFIFRINHKLPIMPQQLELHSNKLYFSMNKCNSLISAIDKCL